MADYLTETGLEVGDIYAGNRSWSEPREAAGLPVATSGPHEVALRRGIARMRHVDDLQRLEGYRALLATSHIPRAEEMSIEEQRLLRMLLANLAGQVVTTQDSLQFAVDLVWSHPQVRLELQELFDVLGDTPSHVIHWESRARR